jgi:NAD(P)-dependent dehydrogenase (short-subunit alcohol dehydrogenase family)
MSQASAVIALFDVRGKTVLVTGGAQGLGRMIADGFVRAGAKVYITSRKADIARDAAAEMSKSGSCTAIAVDLAGPEGCAALAKQIQSAESKLDVLVNNAGRTWGAPLENFPDKAWASVMAINVQTPFTLVRDLLGLLKQAATADNPARVINIGSVAGLTAERLSAFSYSASKAAIHHLSKVLAAELAPYRITVNTIVPGYFPTQMMSHIRSEEERLRELVEKIPLQRLGTADDAVGACLMLASRAGAYMTGSEIVIDGGRSGCR